MKLSKYQIIIVGVVLLITLFLVLAFFGVFSKNNQDQNPYLPSSQITLSLWGYDISVTAMNRIVSAYQETEPLAKNVKIEYREFSDNEQYEQELLRALAEGRGPDIFMIKSENAPQRTPLLYPATTSFISAKNFSEIFPQVISDDAIRSTDEESLVYMSPLSLDVLSLIYNEDIFDGLGISFPPSTWEEVVDISRQIKQTGAGGNIQRAGIALGGIRNIGYLDSLLYALLFQNNASFFDPTRMEVKFDDKARQTIEFYMQFSNPIHPYYTWNESFSYMIDEFVNGSAGMIIAPLSSLDDIYEKNPFMRVEVAPLPQVSADPQQSRTSAVYTLLGVSRQTSYPATAWHVVRALTMSSLNDQYREETGMYPASRNRIASYEGAFDSVVRSFLSARSWDKPQQNSMLPILKELLTDIRERGIESTRALRGAEEKINALYK